MSTATETLDIVRELHDALEHATATMTANVAALAGLSLNNVLRSELVVLDLTGQAHLESSVPYASVGAWAYDSDVTLYAGPNGAAAPARGIGVIFVPAQRAVVWPLAGPELAVFGTAGARVLVTLFSTPQVPSVGGTATGVDGGTP